jgi:ElaB/YqjD/DUF883 family membrane-anchored ribosome-binding protein
MNHIGAETMTDQRLPEGTDEIIDGDGLPEDDAASTDETLFTPDGGPDPAGNSGATNTGPEREPGSSATFDTGGSSSGAADGSASSGGTENDGAAASGAASAFAGFSAQALFDRVDAFKAQGYDQAKSYAQTGLDQASSAIGDVVRMINEAADQIDDRVGTQYGAYARKAADGIGGFGDYFKDKDVDELFDQARELVKKSPAVAIGTAAALGFVVARLARAGFDTKPAGGDGGKSGRAA